LARGQYAKIAANITTEYSLTLDFSVMVSANLLVIFEEINSYLLYTLATRNMIMGLLLFLSLLNAFLIAKYIQCQMGG
jgi:hypothetical protein